MEIDELKKMWRAKSNWRAHIANYVQIKKQKKVNYSPQQYCKQKKINYEAFKVWLKYIAKEDEYVFYISFATEYLGRAKRSLDLVKKYRNTPELKMPLIRDAIVAYAAPFKKSYSRVPINGFRLKEIESFIPNSLQKIHRKICDDRDQIVAHCDLNPRNPRVGLFGITIKGKGYYWKDYQALIPDFDKLIIAVQENLQKYNLENFTSVENYFKEFLNPPKCAEEDPGLPSEEIL